MNVSVAAKAILEMSVSTVNGLAGIIAIIFGRMTIATGVGSWRNAHDCCRADRTVKANGRRSARLDRWH